MINFLIGGILIFLIVNGIKSYFSTKCGCCGGNCYNCKSSCSNKNK